MWDYYNIGNALLQAGHPTNALTISYLATERWAGFHYGYLLRSSAYLSLNQIDQAEAAILDGPESWDGTQTSW